MTLCNRAFVKKKHTKQGGSQFYVLNRQYFLAPVRLSSKTIESCGSTALPMRV